MKNYSDIKSTPGPWTIRTGTTSFTQPDGEIETFISEIDVIGPNLMCGFLNGDDEDTALADAHLIAAAPDMLKMLITLREYVLSEVSAAPGTFIESLINCTDDTIALAFGDETSDLFKEARQLEIEARGEKG
jgi:hypothetical protein